MQKNGTWIHSYSCSCSCSGSGYNCAFSDFYWQVSCAIYNEIQNKRQYKAWNSTLFKTRLQLHVVYLPVEHKKVFNRKTLLKIFVSTQIQKVQLHEISFKDQDKNEDSQQNQLQVPPSFKQINLKFAPKNSEHYSKQCEVSLTDGTGDLDPDGDLQKFQKQRKFNPQVPCNNRDPRALMPLPRHSYHNENR